jgi:hypothetical protein
MIIETHINNIIDSDDDNINNIENKIKYLFNTPPLSYCATYSSLPPFLSVDDEYPLRELVHAAQTNNAVCPVLLILQLQLHSNHLHGL